MQWINKAAKQLIERHPDGKITVSSGVSPSGIYHFGALREILTCEAMVVELQRLGREAEHIHAVDDMDALRKIPPNIPSSFEQYLGYPLCDIPSPDGSQSSYVHYFFDKFLAASRQLGVVMTVWYSHEHYRNGFFVPAIEKVLMNLEKTRQILQSVSGRKLGDSWSPVQILEDKWLKSRQFVSIDTSAKTLVYVDKDGQHAITKYDDGRVKLDWRLDWPARWWLLGVQAEPFGRDHASKGGSYDTGEALVREIFGAEPPLPVKFDFINRVGDTKKMSASTGTGIEISEVAEVLPPEVLRYFIFRSDPSKQLFFDQGEGSVRLVDEFAQLANKERDESEQHLYELCMHGIQQLTVSAVPYSHLVANYQAALKDVDKTLDGLARSEYKPVVESQGDVIRRELVFIDSWLNKWAPDSVKFELLKTADDSTFSDEQKAWFAELADALAGAPDIADGEWFHKALYAVKDKHDLQPKEVFTPLYRLLIGKDAGPRAGWFLSMLPREWLIKRLKFEA